MLTVSAILLTAIGLILMAPSIWSYRQNKAMWLRKDALVKALTEPPEVVMTQASAIGAIAFVGGLLLWAGLFGYGLFRMLSWLWGHAP